MSRSRHHGCTCWMCSVDQTAPLKAARERVALDEIADEIPHRIVVDDETFDALTEAINNPRPPNEALRALFRRTCECHARMAGECMCGAWDDA